MVDDTRNCDEVGAYLEKICPELQGAVLVIHTKNNGEISEAASGKSKEELELLRKQSNEIDTWKSPYKAIVSVLMLKEGWDVRNVTTIVGLRAYVAKSNILPEQTLGRGLRRMYFGSDAAETVSVMGTPAFMDFVESIQSEGVTFERVPMGGEGGERQDSLVVEVDTRERRQGPRRARHCRCHGSPAASTASSKISASWTRRRSATHKLPLKPFTPEETREIVFKTMLDAEVDHTIQLDGAGPADYRSVVALLRPPVAQGPSPGRRLRRALSARCKTFMRDHLFTRRRSTSKTRSILRNLSEPEVGKVLFDRFQRRHQRPHDPGNRHARASRTVSGCGTRARSAPSRAAILPRQEVRLQPDRRRSQRRTASNSRFAAFLEAAPDVQAFAKNYLAVGFKLDYVKANGDLSNYTPDFIVRTTDGTVWIVETKGREELDLPQKMARLRQWCADATEASADEDGPRYGFVYVDQDEFREAQADDRSRGWRRVPRISGGLTMARHERSPTT